MANAPRPVDPGATDTPSLDVDPTKLLDAAIQADQAEDEERIRQFWINFCGMPAHLNYQQGKTWARERQAKEDSAADEWNKKVAELERSIELRCRERMLAAGFCETELQGRYVPCLPSYVAEDDPRSPDFKEALRLWQLDGRAMQRVLLSDRNQLPESQPRSRNVIEALRAVKRELDNWNALNSPSEGDRFAEDVPVGHPLHAAVADLQLYYGGRLPKPALRHWRTFLRLARNDDEQAENEADWLTKWVKNEISVQNGENGPSQAEVIAMPKCVKRSTERGEGSTKLIAALTKHHKYADGGCLNTEPIGNNELARLADVAESTASEFFRKQFNGHKKYRAICADVVRLLTALKLLNHDFAPHHLFGANPAGEDERKDDE